MYDEYAEAGKNANGDAGHDDDLTIRASPVPHAPAYQEWQNGPVIARPTQTSEPVLISRSTTLPPPPQPLVRESAARQRVRRRHGTRSSGIEWAWVIVAAALLGVVIILGLSGVLLLRSSQTERPVLPTAVADLSALPTPVDLRTAGGQLVTGQTVTLSDGYSLVLQPWDGQSRFTLLVMGIDRRADETGLAFRTDTMILLSVDPRTRRIGMLSIPRDLWVEVPGWSQYQRVNTPMVLGENNRPGTGPQLAMQTVQYNLGIRVHDYLVVDFQALTGLVDAIGGIEVSIDYTINDRLYPDMNYGYDPFFLAAGTHVLDGPTALKFARTRHGDNDIRRGERQQQVITAIRERIMDFNLLPQLIIRAPMLLDAFNDNIHTSMSLEQMIRLAWYVKDIPGDNITSGIMDYRYMSDWTTTTGAQVLIPNRARLGNLMIEVFGADYSQ
jgi:polyisoprenyl-teichoic acid--peptidoglycan teichoic acid transferase